MFYSESKSGDFPGQSAAYVGLFILWELTEVHLRVRDSWDPPNKLNQLREMDDLFPSA